MTQTMSLSVKYRNEYMRTNESDGSKYVVYCYRVLKSNSPLAVEQLRADTIAAKHNIIIDDETGDMLFRTTRVVPEGCNIIRTSSGRWIADKSKLRQLAALAKEFPELGLGQALADRYLKGALPQQDVPQHEPKVDDGGGIDPFNP